MSKPLEQFEIDLACEYFRDGIQAFNEGLAFDNRQAVSWKAGYRNGQKLKGVKG